MEKKLQLKKRLPDPGHFMANELPTKYKFEKKQMVFWYLNFLDTRYQN